MIDRQHSLPLAKQAKALGISRGMLYYAARPVPAADLALLRCINKLHLEYPFAGSRMMQGLLKQAQGHKIYPYLLRNVPILPPS